MGIWQIGHGCLAPAGKYKYKEYINKNNVNFSSKLLLFFSSFIFIGKKRLQQTKIQINQ